MTMTIDAVYESGVFRPLKPMELPEGEQVKLTVNAPDLAELERRAPDPRRLAEIVAEIAALAVPHGEPDYGGRDHDKILYGGPDGAR